MTELSAQGLTVTLPSGWEARIARRSPTAAAIGERTYPVMHLASFPLPEQRDDFGGNVTRLMRSSDTFVTLFEYGPESVNQKLFATKGVPQLTASLFSPTKLQRRVAGQVGTQLFFQQGGRAFCLYVVAGSRASLPSIIANVNRALTALHIQAVRP
jgi:hypothetical protein